MIELFRSPWRAGGVAGIAIAIVDALFHFSVLGFQPSRPIVEALEIADFVANIAVLVVVGEMLARLGGTGKNGAEAGVTAGAIAGVSAVALSQLFPVPGLTPESMQLEPLRNAIANFSQNVFQGGVLCWFSTWLASKRAPATSRK